jgi:hypothetical protein
MSKAKAQKFLEVVEAERANETFLKLIKDVANQNIQDVEDLTELEKQFKFLEKALKWENIREELTDLCEELMSEEELDGLIKFFSSKVGKSWLKKQPMYSARAAQIGVDAVNRAMPTTGMA